MFERLSSGVANALGKPVAFLLACSVVLAWALSGPLFHDVEKAE